MKNNDKLILKIALYAGEILLKNGAETYRVEETIEKICKDKLSKNISTYATQTGIFVSDNSLENINLLKRIRYRTINLDKISKVNDFARNFVTDNTICPKKALAELCKIDREKKYNKLIVTFFSALASAFFALLFSGGLNDFFITFFISLIATRAYQKINILSETSFLPNIISGSIIALLTLIARSTGCVQNMNSIIVGAIMPLVPGVALTNGLRDFITGDFITGTTRVAEALLIAISIAVGVGSILELWIYLFGGTI